MLFLVGRVVKYTSVCRYIHDIESGFFCATLLHRVNHASRSYLSSPHSVIAVAAALSIKPEMAVAAGWFPTLSYS